MGPLAYRLRCSPMTQETGIQSQVESYQRLKKWYLMPPSLTLSIIRYGSRVKWSNPGKGVTIEDGTFGSPLTMVANFYIYIESHITKFDQKIQKTWKDYFKNTQAKIRVRIQWGNGNKIFPTHIKTRINFFQEYVFCSIEIAFNIFDNI